MRVLLINATYDYGSTGSIVQNIARCCSNSGVDCYIAYAFSRNVVLENSFKIGGKLSRFLHSILSRIGGKQGYFSSFATRRLTKYMSQVKPDVVHLHNLHSSYIHLNLLLKYLAEKNIPTIVTLHDCWFYTGGCTHYTSVKCDKWKYSCGQCPRRYDETPAYLYDGSSSVIKDRKKYFREIKRLKVTGVSKWITEEAISGIFKGREHAVIYNGIDLKVFKPTPSDFRNRNNIENKFVILGPASKWLDPLNDEDLSFLLSQMNNDEVFVVYGSNTEDIKYDGKLIIIGFIHDEKTLAGLYSSADVFVNCTHEESLSLVNLEAQACGTPVVTYDGTGVQETVNNICGFSVQQNDVFSLCNKIKFVKEKGKDYFSADCVNWVNSHFNMLDNYIKYIDLYKSMV